MGLAKEWTVYGLLDPDTRALMYVGMTSVGVSKRLGEHVYIGKRTRDRGTRCARWIRSLLDAGKRPIPTVFAVAAEEAIARHLERELAGTYRPAMNGNMTGQPGGGSGGVGRPKHPVPVYSLDTGEVWPSQSAAARALGVSARCVRWVLDGRGQTAGGHRLARVAESLGARRVA